MVISTQETLQIADNFYSAGDYKNAYNSYTDAAQKGSGEAAYKLGLMYEKGIYVKRDYKAAMQWYVIAAGKGHQEAKKKFQNGLKEEEEPTIEPVSEPVLGSEPSPTPESEFVQENDSESEPIATQETSTVPIPTTEPIQEPEPEPVSEVQPDVQPITPPPYIPKVDNTVDDPVETAKLDGQLKQLLSKKEYKKAYDLCLDYLDEGKGVAYVQNILPRLRKNVSDYYSGKRTLHVVLFIITVIIGMTVSIMVRSNM